MKEQTTLHVISRDERNTETLNALKSAALNCGVRFNVIDSAKMNMAEIPVCRKQDLLYRISTDNDARNLFKQMMITQPAVTTIYNDRGLALVAGDNVVQATLLHRAHDLPINKTVFSLTNNKGLLDKYVGYLGGYPVIIKASGGSHGVGVMRVDSAPSLYSVADYLVATGGTFIMRQFVEHDEHARLIVLGDKVIDSIAYKRIGDDFRTNVGSKIDAQVKDFAKSIQDAAVKSVNCLGSSFGGVDIMVDKNGAIHIAEVNIPCFFMRAQMVSGVDTAQQLVNYLIAKSKTDSEGQ